MSTVTTTRIQYTPSPFARASLLHLAEVGSLTALKPHTSQRANLGGLLLLLVEKGSGEVTAAGKRYRLGTGDVAVIDCSQPYSHSTGEDLWTIHWAHFDGPAALSIYSKFLARAGRPIFTAPDIASYLKLFSDLFKTASGASYVRDMSINTILSSLLEKVMGDCWGGEKAEPKDNVEAIRLYMDSHYMELGQIIPGILFGKDLFGAYILKSYGHLPYKVSVQCAHQKDKGTAQIYGEYFGRNSCQGGLFFGAIFIKSVQVCGGYFPKRIPETLEIMDSP